MGLAADLSEIFHFTYIQELENGLTEHEIDHVFWGISDNLPEPHPEEVLSYKYINYSNLKNDVDSNPGEYTAWFKLIYERVGEIINSQTIDFSAK